MKSIGPIHTNTTNAREIPLCHYFLLFINSITGHIEKPKETSASRKATSKVL